jgi:hypothetical protein
MSGDFAASQSPGPAVRKRYFPNSKAATGVMARNELRPRAAGLANPRGDPLALLQAIRIRKIPRIQGDSRAQTMIETGPPFATALVQRARRLSLVRPKG